MTFVKWNFLRLSCCSIREKLENSIRKWWESYHNQCKSCNKFFQQPKKPETWLTVCSCLNAVRKHENSKQSRRVISPFVFQTQNRNDFQALQLDICYFGVFIAHSWHCQVSRAAHRDLLLCAGVGSELCGLVMSINVCLYYYRLPVEFFV